MPEVFEWKGGVDVWLEMRAANSNPLTGFSEKTAQATARLTLPRGRKRVAVLCPWRDANGYSYGPPDNYGGALDLNDYYRLLAYPLVADESGELNRMEPYHSAFTTNVAIALELETLADGFDLVFDVFGPNSGSDPLIPLDVYNGATPAAPPGRFGLVAKVASLDECPLLGTPVLSATPDWACPEANA